jgi:phenylalanyl-tRNA synthetase beta chain
MGGVASKVQAATRDVLLESAWFKPELVRSGRRKLGLDTDASYRFERGAVRCPTCRLRIGATHLLVEVCGGEVVETECDVYPVPHSEAEILVRVARVNALIGSSLEAKQIQALLGRLQLPTRVEGAALRVRIPSLMKSIGMKNF